MSERGPSEERVFLSAHERRQLRLLEAQWANADAASASEVDVGSTSAEPIPLRWILLVVFGLLTLVGLATDVGALVLLGVVSALTVVATHACRIREQEDGQ